MIYIDTVQLDFNSNAQVHEIPIFYSGSYFVFDRTCFRIRFFQLLIQIYFEFESQHNFRWLESTSLRTRMKKMFICFLSFLHSFGGSADDVAWGFSPRQFRKNKANKHWMSLPTWPLYNNTHVIIDGITSLRRLASFWQGESGNIVTDRTE